MYICIQHKVSELFVCVLTLFYRFACLPNVKTIEYLQEHRIKRKPQLKIFNNTLSAYSCIFSLEADDAEHLSTTNVCLRSQQTELPVYIQSKPFKQP